MAGRAKQPLKRRTTDIDPFLGCEQLGKMAVVDASISAARTDQLDDPSACQFVNSMGRGSASVAMNEPIGALLE